MPVFLDVESRLNRSSVDLAAREIRAVFDALGRDVSKGLGGSLSNAFRGFDSSGARRELQAMQLEYRKLADAELEAARVATRSAREVEVAQRRAAEVTAKYTAESSQAARAQALLADSQARAARDMRTNADAIVASEAAHRKLGGATTDSAAAASAASRVFNGVGIASVAGFGAAFVETTKKAGDFQQSQQRLVSSAGETAQGLKEVSDGILKLAGQVGYSAQELSNGMYTVEKAGYRGADGVKVLSSAAQLAKAENADLGDVLNGLTTSMHDFGYGTDRAAEVASKMNTAVGMAKTNLQDFSGALHSVEPIAAAAHLKLEDVYGSLAQITQSGTSPDQGAQNMAHSITQLMKPTQQMRDEMGQMGLDARDVQAHLGDRGFAGTVQMLSNTIREHMTPAGQVVIDTMFKSQQATDAATQVFNNLPPAAKAVAQAIKDGTLSYKDFRKSRGGLDVEQANEINQWNNLNNKVTGYSAALKSGQGDIQTYEQALALMTGGQDSLKTVLQLVGDNADATNDKIKAVKDTTAETDGTVKGFNETQETLNAKMADAKAAFGAAAIEIGNAFVPVMTDVANVAKNVGDFMGKHPAIMHGVVDALGVLGAAWLTFKAINIVEAILTPIARGLGGIVTQEEAATAGAGRLSGALSLVGTAAAGIAAAAAADNMIDQNPALRDINHAGGGPTAIPQWLADHLGARQSREFFHNLFSGDGHAAGGAIHGSGPTGIDSVPAMLAPGEHVLTHQDVAKMGGHPGVYAFRQSLHGGLAIHRSGGGGPGGSSDPGPGGANSNNLISALQGAGIDPRMYPLIQGFAKTEGNNPSGVPTLGFTDSQAGSTLSGHAAALAAQLQARQSVAGTFPASGTPQQQASWMATVVGQNGVQSDWQGNAQPSRQSYVDSIVRGFGGKVPIGSQSDPVYVSYSEHGTPGRGPAGQSGYYTANPGRVSSAEERLRHIDEEIRIAEERKANLKADASQAEKDRLEEQIRHLHAERDQAQGKLTQAQQGTFHAGSGGGSGGMGMGGPNLPVPLPERFGLGKGLPGLAEWTVGYLEDLVLGPMETGISAAMQQAGLPAPGSTGTGLIGIAQALSGGGGMPEIGPGAGPLGALTGGSLGGAGAASSPGDLGADAGAPSAGAGGGGGSSSTGGRGGSAPFGYASSPSALGSIFGPPKSAPGAPGAPPSAAGNIGQPFPLPTNPEAWANPPVSGAQAPGIFGTFGPLLGGPLPGTSNSPAGALGDAAMNDAMKNAFAHPAPPKTPMGVFDPSQNPFLNAQHHATGGPSGSDTIPSWLSPGEYVENKSAVDKYGAAFMGALNQGRIDPSSVQYFDEGGPPAPAPAAPPPPPAPPGPGTKDAVKAGPNQQPPGQSKPQQPGAPGQPKPGEPKPGEPGKPKPGQEQHALDAAAKGLGALPGGEPGNADTHQGLNTPGSSKELFGAELPASGGIGFGGGLLGAAEGAASQAAGMAASMGSFGGAGGAVSSAMNMAFQLANRTAAFGAQAAGIGVEGILSTLLPADSPLSNFANTLPGKVLAGVAGVRPGSPNTAGQTQPPLAGSSDDKSETSMAGTKVGVQVNGDMHVHANDADKFHSSLQNDHNAAQTSYPTNTP